MCQECDWESVLEQIDEMMEEERFEFAEDTLVGIREWVEEHKHVTEKQRDAIDNIENCGDR